ncbi:hypothetical protein LCGC14_2498690 [marine sediment metagenome]|uniref:Uncharacterized protein n=1 Tax=marine sediment metagenome TaxID=412755 RepID=A0A0F9B389_9ZZZZ
MANNNILPIMLVVGVGIFAVVALAKKEPTPPPPPPPGEFGVSIDSIIERI